jgi:hypothetical protein
MKADSTKRHRLVAIRAYRYWQERGCLIGSPEVDWFHAEQELRVYMDSRSFPFSSIAMRAVTN